MNWKQFWNKQAEAKDPLLQVARTGKSLDVNILQAIADHIVTVLNLKPSDTLLDVCCGNGELTYLLSKSCKKVVGIDYSDRLIAHAQQKYPEITFICMDALNPDLNVFHEPFDKINLYFSFQYFEQVSQGEQVISNLLKWCKPSGTILLGDVPDADKFFTYYHSPRRLLQLIKQQLTNTNDMGKFWSASELQVICKRLQIHGEKLIQPAHLPYAHYRMDYLIQT